MNKVAIIYTKEEARNMPPEKRPICYRVPGKIYTALFEACGHASLCWNPRPEGVFDPDECSKAATTALFVIAEELERLGVTFEQLNDQPDQPCQTQTSSSSLAQSTSLGSDTASSPSADSLPDSGR